MSKPTHTPGPWRVGAYGTTVMTGRPNSQAIMPRKDPITGVPVMTMGEFLNAEAQREGTTPEKIMEEIHQAEQEDNAQQIAEYKRPEVALKMLKDAAAEEVRIWYENIETGRSRRALRRAYPESAPKKPYNNPRPPYPLEIVEIVAANYAGGFRHSGGSIHARCRCDDGSIHALIWGFDYWSGSRMEPPDQDEFLTYDPTPKEMRKLLKNRGL